MTNSNVWKLLKCFKETERWGDPDKMNASYLLKLDAYVEHVKKDYNNALCILTTEAWKDKHGHSKGSYHYFGRAVDCRFIDPESRKPLTVKDHLMIAIRSPFLGVGIYTWSANGPYLHFDDRKESERKIWVCERRGVYRNMDIDFLKRAFA